MFRWALLGVFLAFLAGCHDHEEVTAGGTTARVPNLVGLPLHEVEATVDIYLCGNRGASYYMASNGHDESWVPRVTWQRPRAGQTVERGTIVRMGVRTGASANARGWATAYCKKPGLLVVGRSETDTNPVNVYVPSLP